MLRGLASHRGPHDWQIKSPMELYSIIFGLKRQSTEQLVLVLPRGIAGRTYAF